MKNIFKYIAGTLLASFVIASCHEDNGNYTYLTDAELNALIIRIDTTGMENRYAFSGDYYPGDVIKLSPKVHYKYPEDLKYSWIVYSYPYSSVVVGNANMYPKPDTISHDLDLEWTVDLKKGSHTCHLIVQDTVRGLSASMNMGGYFDVFSLSNLQGVYVLSEYDGQTDIDFYDSDLCLIYGGDMMIPHYYSQELRFGMLPGKPKFMAAGEDYYYVFTEENGYRLNFDGLQLMETFDEMFYQVPDGYNPQAMRYVNNCEFLLNDGKLHVLYTKKDDDRKFSAPIGGDYQAGVYLSDETLGYRSSSSKLNAHEIIYDEKNKKFRPYFQYDTQVSEFGPTVAGAYADANKLPENPIAMKSGYGGWTYTVVPVNGVPYLYTFNFYDVVDDGDLSADGVNAIIDLSGCKDIMNLKHFIGNNHGSAFYYATEKTLYSFSPTSGQTTAHEFFTCAENEEITCLSIFFGDGGGGFPTAGAVLWAGVWNESTKEGKLLEWEIDPYSGIAVSEWGPIFAPSHELLHVTSGFGKIKSIVAIG